MGIIIFLIKIARNKLVVSCGIPSFMPIPLFQQIVLKFKGHFSGNHQVGCKDHGFKF